MKSFVADSNENFKLILILSFLAKVPVTIPYSRDDEFQTDFLGFLLAISTGSESVVKNGMLNFKPGSLKGGKIKYASKNIGGLFDCIAVLGPYMKEPLRCTLMGVTHCEGYSCDMLKVVYESVLKTLGVSGSSMIIKKRGFAPSGQGLVEVRLDTIKKLNAISFKELEVYSRINGIVVTARINSNFTQRMVTTIKESLDALGNVKVSNVLCNRNDSGPSPGLECSVYIQGKVGMLYKTVGSSSTSQESPETVAKVCCSGLLVEVSKGRIFDNKLSLVIFCYMSLAWGVSYLRIGELEDEMKSMLNVLRSMLGVEYYLIKQSDGYILKIAGCGYNNTNSIS